MSAREWEILPSWLKSVGKDAVINAVVSEMEAHADGPKFPTSGYRTCGMAKDAIGKALGINLMPADREENARVHNYVQGLMNSWTTQQRHGNEYLDKDDDLLLLSRASDCREDDAKAAGTSPQSATITHASMAAYMEPPAAFSDATKKRRISRATSTGSVRQTRARACDDGNAAMMPHKKLYVLGGENGEGALSTVHVYDPRLDTWQSAPSMSTARRGAAAAVLSGRLHVVGGESGERWDENTQLLSVEVYDVANGAWEPAPSMPPPAFSTMVRCHFAAAALDDRFYVVGGGHDAVCTFLVYDEPKREWSRSDYMQPTMAERRTRGAGAALNGKLYVVGGNTGFEALESVEVYDLQTNKWSLAAPMATARSAHGVAALDGQLYAFGGASWEGEWLSSMEVYDPQTNTWRLAPPMSVARSAFGSCVVDDILYVFGGDSSYKSVDDFDTTTYVECYDPKKGAWTRVARLPAGLRNCASVAL